MVLRTKNRLPIVASPPARAPATLRDLHDREPDPRRKAALRRLETVFGVPLERIPADIDRFDACFPPGGFGGPGLPWISERAYRHWRTTVRRTIRRHAVAPNISVTQVRHVQARLLPRTSGRSHTAIPAKEILEHADVEGVRAYYANFRKATSGPKSD